MAVLTARRGRSRLKRRRDASLPKAEPASPTPEGEARSTGRSDARTAMSSVRLAESTFAGKPGQRLVQVELSDRFLARELGPVTLVA
jgi:hypothetical protein